jgi:hypothetical protein
MIKTVAALTLMGLSLATMAAPSAQVTTRHANPMLRTERSLSTIQRQNNEILRAIKGKRHAPKRHIRQHHPKAHAVITPGNQGTK